MERPAATPTTASRPAARPLSRVSVARYAIFGPGVSSRNKTARMNSGKLHHRYEPQKFPGIATPIPANRCDLPIGSPWRFECSRHLEGADLIRQKYSLHVAIVVESVLRRAVKSVILHPKWKCHLEL